MASSFSGIVIHSPPSVQFDSAIQWARLPSMKESRLMKESPDLLQVYSTAIRLILQIFWLGCPVHDRPQMLTKIRKIFQEAAIVAVERKQYNGWNKSASYF
jgi:hypothetical protein